MPIKIRLTRVFKRFSYVLTYKSVERFRWTHQALHINQPPNIVPFMVCIIGSSSRSTLSSGCFIHVYCSNSRTHSRRVLYCRSHLRGQALGKIQLLSNCIFFSRNKRIMCSILDLITAIQTYDSQCTFTNDVRFANSSKHDSFPFTQVRL